jgi:hypothetical protein
MNFFYHEIFGSIGQIKAAAKHNAWNYHSLNKNAATVSIAFLKCKKHRAESSHLITVKFLK